MNGWLWLLVLVPLAAAAGFWLLWRWLGSRLFTPPGAAEAMACVWKALDGAGPPPQVFWVKCEDSSGYADQWGRRVMGAAVRRHVCNVAWWPECKFADTALAHEFAHQVRDRFGVAEETQHQLLGFQADVSLAEAALKKAGL